MDFERPLTDWRAISNRNSRSVQTLIGWTFWDPIVIGKLETVGLESYLAYVGGKFNAVIPAGWHAVAASSYSMPPEFMEVAVAALEANTTVDEVWELRNEAIVEALNTYVPDHVENIAAMSGWIWDAVEACPIPGRLTYAATLDRPRSDDPLLSTWQAVNCIREFRGDGHFAILTAEGLTKIEVGILHNDWVGYEKDWLPLSRGATSEAIEQGWEDLASRGLVGEDGRVNQKGLDYRQWIEDRTDELSKQPWQAIGVHRSDEFARLLEPPCEVLLRRVDETAGDKYQPASRHHERLAGSQAADITQTGG